MTLQNLLSGGKSDGFSFRIVDQCRDALLLAKSKPGHSRELWETAIIQHQPAETIRGRSYPARDILPSDESWGSLGWSYADEQLARAGFARLSGKSTEMILSPQNSSTTI